jgi:MFS family permease
VADVQTNRPALLKSPRFAGLVALALAAELGYAVLNISTLPVYLRQERGLPEGKIGLALVAFLLSEALFKSFMGRLADRFGPRPFMLAGPALSLVACLATLALPNGPLAFPAILALRVVDGLAAATFWPAAFSYAGDLTEPNRRQEAMSLLNLCYLLGLAVALPLGGLVDDLAHSARAGLFLAAGLFAVTGTLSLAFVHAPHASQPEPETAKLGLDLAILAPVLLTLVTFVGVGFPMAILKLFAVDALHLTETQFGALVIPGALAMAALSVPLARVGQRLGSTNSVRLGLGLCAAGMSAIAAGAGLPALRNLAVLAVAAIPVGLGFVLALPAWMAAVSQIDPKRQGSNLGAVMAAQGFGAIVGAPIGALLYEHGHYSPFIACAACIWAGWLLSLAILKPAKPLT